MSKRLFKKLQESLKVIAIENGKFVRDKSSNAKKGKDNKIPLYDIYPAREAPKF